jgi:hypothetical protein
MLIAMLLILVVAVFNCALGFALAVYFGHGPSWPVRRLPEVRRLLRRLLRLDRPAH